MFAGAIAFIVAFIGQPIVHEAIQLSHIRPSRLMVDWQFGPSKMALPEGLTITADDRAGRLNVAGDPKKIQQLREIANLFDVEPKTVNLVTSITSSLDHSQCYWAGTTSNGQGTEVLDVRSGLSLAITPRIDATGLITVSVIVEQYGSTARLMSRLGSGEEWVLSDDRKVVDLKNRNGKGVAASKLEGLEGITISIKASILDAAGSGDKNPENR